MSMSNRGISHVLLMLAHNILYREVSDTVSFLNWGKKENRQGGELFLLGINFPMFQFKYAFLKDTSAARQLYFVNNFFT